MSLSERERWTTRGGAAALAAPPCRVDDGAGYLNLNFAVWVLPSLSVTISWRQVPAHALSVFQT